MNANDQNIIYTFYRLGPSFITWFYPIDPTPIEKEILDPMGQIGTEEFEDFPGAIEHLNPFDPKWFRKKGNELVCKKRSISTHPKRGYPFTFLTSSS